MFLKGITKENKTTGELKMRFRLCESYRSGHTVKHHTILDLGELPELLHIEQRRKLGLRISSLIKDEKNPLLFNTSIDDVVEELAQKFYKEIRQKERLDFQENKEQLVDIDSLKHKNIREIGIEWLLYQGLNQLNLKSVFENKGWSEEQINLALTHIISRAAYPASELKTTSWIKENSGVCELTGYPIEKITKDKLYGISHNLYELKNELEQHLSFRTNELFDLDDSIILYDLTNTYFEGRMETSKIAKFGKSKEKRNDAKLVVLAIVVNTEGFLKFSNIYEGNMADCKTLAGVVKNMSERTTQSSRKPVVVMDAGIATEENLAMLRKEGYHYMCVTRSRLKNYKIDTSCSPVKITDKKEQSITLQRIKIEGSADNYLEVTSTAKALKESGINSRFTQRFEDGITQINESLQKKGGIKKVEKVWERIGRLKQKYPTAHKYYEMEIIENEDKTISQIKWKRKKLKPTEGIYFLRTSLDEKDEQNQWKIYNAIREIEYSFRVLKTDLDLRPIYHKTDKAAMAHLHLGLLAYWSVNTIRHQLKQKGINNQWKDLVRKMNTQKAVTTSVKNSLNSTIVIRQCSEPNQSVQEIYNALGYKPKPFTRKKFVVPPEEIQKLQTLIGKDFHPV
jgi:hypothetical protein